MPCRAVQLTDALCLDDAAGSTEVSLNCARQGFGAAILADDAPPPQPDSVPKWFVGKGC